MTESVFEPPPPPRPRQFRLATLLALLTIAAGAFGFTRTWPVGALTTLSVFGLTAVVFVVPFAFAARVIGRSARRGHSYLLAAILSQWCLPTGLALASLEMITLNTLLFRPYNAGYDVVMTDKLAGTILSWLAACYISSTGVVVLVDFTKKHRHTETWRAVVAGWLSASLIALVTLMWLPTVAPELGANKIPAKGLLSFFVCGFTGAIVAEWAMDHWRRGVPYVKPVRRQSRLDPPDADDETNSDK